MNNSKFLKPIVSIILVFCSCLCYAQSAKDIETLKIRAAQKVGLLNDYIAYIANPQKQTANRLKRKHSALALFVNNGRSFTEIVEYKDGKKETIERKGAEMQVSSSNTKTIKKMLMSKYFDNLMSLRYKEVKIESTDIADMRVSQIQPYGDGRYVCSVYFDQNFIGKRGDGSSYKDITRKWVVCYITVDKTVDGDEYMVELGDVHVESTKILR